MSTVFVSVTMSLDGYSVPEGMDLEHAEDPTYKDWMNRWMQLQAWVIDQQFFRQNLGLGEDGETGRDNDLCREIFERTGVSIMGKRMFDLGEQMWPEEAPFHTPVFVLTHEVRQPWERPGGTTFHFVNDGIDSALDQAKAVADGRDIRISGGADVICQYLNAGLVDELHLALSPVVFAGGGALFAGLDPDRIALDVRNVVHAPKVTHLHYTISPQELQPADSGSLRGLR